ncbi:MAG: hypothetical protein Q4G16_00305 [Cruoricaptor ignavus]|nr:hypothetical protein [Cruoricaptor ignavus]
MKREKNDNTNDLIAKKIKEGKPLMVTRYGSTESRAILNHLLMKDNTSDFTAIYKHLIGEMNLYWKHDPKFLNNLCTLSGFFPNDEQLLEQFVTQMLEDSKNLDVLGIWNEMEEFIPNIPENTHLCKIRELEPWFYDLPWSYELKDRKVLVIHPFNIDIINQYHKNDRGGSNYISIIRYCPPLN